MQKKTINLMLAAAFAALSVSAQTTDSILYETKYDTGWRKDQLEILNYNAMCTYNSRLFKNPGSDSQDWINSSLSTYTYDGSGKITERLSQTWDNLNYVWVNNTWNIYSYNGAGNKYTNTYKKWNSGSGSWQNSIRLTIEMNTVGSITYLEYEYFFDNEWQKSSKDVNNYDADNFLIFDKLDTWAGDHWENFNKTNYTYDKNHTKGNQLFFYWDTNTLQWVKGIRQINDFVPGTSYAKDFLIQDYLGYIPEWINSLKQQSEVNSDGLFTSGLTQVWDNTIPGWTKLGKTKQEYYLDGSIRIVYSDGWDVGTNTWAYHSRISYTHNGCIIQSLAKTVNANNHKNNLAESNKSPNPGLPADMFANNNGYSFEIQMHNGLIYHYDISAKPAKAVSQKAESAASAVVTKPEKALIYPNPAKGYFFISPNKNASGNITLKMFDAKGQMVINRKIAASGLQKIELPNLSKGLYSVVLVSSKGTESQQLLIQ